MVALNGTSLNGTSLNGAWVAPATLPRRAAQSRATLAFVDRWPHPPLDEPEGELARLEAEVVTAKARADSAKERLAAREADVRTVLRMELIASRDAVAEMEREHEMTLAMVRSAAQSEVERIRAEARQLAPGPTVGVLNAYRPGVNDAE